MTAPGIATLCFLQALGIGGILGILYGFLRPLRPRLTTLADLVFALATFWGWIYMVFAICGGDSRMSCTMALFLGVWATDSTVGKWLRPVFSLFWRGIGRSIQWIFAPIKKIFHCFPKFYNFLLASGKKWVTIEGTSTKVGGADHGKKKDRREGGKGQNQSRGKGRFFGCRRVVFGGTGGAVRRH